MNSNTSIRRQSLALTFQSLCILTFCLFWFGGDVLAQTITATSGFTPSGLKPGAPAGSYALTGFENVNLFNGNLNFNLPFLKIGGRGDSGMQMTVSLDSVKWTVENFTIEGTEGSASCGNPGRSDTGRQLFL